jgi:hypothetical protein
MKKGSRDEESCPIAGIRLHRTGEGLLKESVIFPHKNEIKNIFTNALVAFIYR